MSLNNKDLSTPQPLAESRSQSPNEVPEFQANESSIENTNETKENLQ